MSRLLAIWRFLRGLTMLLKASKSERAVMRAYASLDTMPPEKVRELEQAMMHDQAKKMMERAGYNTTICGCCGATMYHLPHEEPSCTCTTYRRPENTP